MGNLRLEDLTVWVECRKLKIELSSIARNLPEEEKYRLRDQLIRASRSITNNIAEGYGRFYYKENISFLRKARGSLFECYDHLCIAYDDNYITEETLKIYKTKIESCAKLINGYIRYLRKEISSENE